MTSSHPLRHTCILLLIAVALLGLTACQTGPSTSDRDIQPITYDALRTLLANADREHAVVLVDVRTAKRFQDGHLPGAINITLPDMVQADPRLAAAEHIVVYAQNAEDALADAGAKTLIRLGYTGVRDFRGGVAAWTSHDQKLVKSAK